VPATARWESQEAAERFYSGEWLARIRARYGTEPTISYYKTVALTNRRAARRRAWLIGGGDRPCGAQSDIHLHPGAANTYGPHLATWLDNAGRSAGRSS
jgi:hypothetical protein